MPTLDFVSMLVALNDTIKVDGPLWLLVTGICWLMAMIFGVTSAMQLKSAAEENRGTTYKAPLMTFVAAVLMASSPTFLKSIVATAYGDAGAAGSPLSYVIDQSSTSPFHVVMQVVSFGGYCFFIRGIWVLKEAGEPQRYHQSTVVKAVIILLAGMMAIYIDVTLKVLGNTLGWDLSKYISG